LTGSLTGSLPHNLISRGQVDKYKAEHRGRMGRPAKTDKRPAEPAEDK
jgi:hypothetical protein